MNVGANWRTYRKWINMSCLSSKSRLVLGAYSKRFHIYTRSTIVLFFWWSKFSLHRLISQEVEAQIEAHKVWWTRIQVLAIETKAMLTTFWMGKLFQVFFTKLLNPTKSSKHDYIISSFLGPFILRTFETWPFEIHDQQCSLALYSRCSHVQYTLYVTWHFYVTAVTVGFQVKASLLMEFIGICLLRDLWLSESRQYGSFRLTEMLHLKTTSETLPWSACRIATSLGTCSFQQVSNSIQFPYDSACNSEDQISIVLGKSSFNQHESTWICQHLRHEFGTKPWNRWWKVSKDTHGPCFPTTKLALLA